MVFSRLARFGSASILVGGGFLAYSTSYKDTKNFVVPKIMAAEELAKGRRRPIEDEDKAIFLSSLSVLKPSRQKITEWDSNWDKRDPEGLVKPLRPDEADDIEKRRQRDEKVEAMSAKAKRTLVLVRHGQYDMSSDLDSNRRLTELGRQQAEATGRRLADMYENIKANATTDENGNKKIPTINFVKSTKVRATETADIIMKNFPGEAETHTKCDLIREGAPCYPEPPHPEWEPSPAEFFVEGARIEAGFRKYVHRADPDQTVDSIDVLVCHGNVIRYFVCRALQLPPEAWLRFAVRNGSITTLTVSPSGNVTVTSMGDSGHIPVDKLTFN